MKIVRVKLDGTMDEVQVTKSKNIVKYIQQPTPLTPLKYKKQHNPIIYISLYSFYFKSSISF